MGVKWDPVDPAFRADPYPTYEALVREDPFHRSPYGPLVLSRYDDVMAVLRHPAASSDFRKSPQWGPLYQDPEAPAPAFIFLDPPDHTRLRGLVSRAFTPKRVEELRPRAQRVVDEVLGKAAVAGGMEVVGQLAFPLPVLMICELLGVPSSDVGEFKEWSAVLARGLDPGFALPTGMQERFRESRRRALGYFEDLIGRRRRQPGEDLLSALIEAEEQGERLTEKELLSTLNLLLIAGHETTVNLLANGVLAFCRYPGEFARLRADLSLVRSCVEEVMRFDPPVHILSRVPTEEIVVCSGVVPQFADLVLLPAATGRDPAQFRSPSTFDVGRTENRHLGFGFGAHHCLGAPLARMEAQVVFSSLARRFASVKLEQDPPPYKDNLTLRGVAQLPVSFS